MSSVVYKSNGSMTFSMFTSSKKTKLQHSMRCTCCKESMIPGDTVHIILDIPSHCDACEQVIIKENTSMVECSRWKPDPGQETWADIHGTVCPTCGTLHYPEGIARSGQSPIAISSTSIAKT
jgi:hypothetical protein